MDQPWRNSKPDEAACSKGILARARERLSATQIADARKWFDEADADGGGSLDEDEVFEAMNNLVGGRLAREHVSQLFGEIDVDGSGAISFRELNQMLRRTRQSDAETKRRTAPEVVTPGDTIEVVDLRHLRREIYKTVRTNAVHADIEASLENPTDDPLLSSTPPALLATRMHL